MPLSAGLVPVLPPGLCLGLGRSQSHIVPQEPPEHLARLVMLVHSLAGTPTEDIAGVRQGARLVGRTQTAPQSGELQGLICL